MKAGGILTDEEVSGGAYQASDQVYSTQARCLAKQSVRLDGVVAHVVRWRNLEVDARLAWVGRANSRLGAHRPLAVGDEEGLATHPCLRGLVTRS
jgi:hypothetical protein